MYLEQQETKETKETPYKVDDFGTHMSNIEVLRFVEVKFDAPRGGLPFFLVLTTFGNLCIRHRRIGSVALRKALPDLNMPGLKYCGDHIVRRMVVAVPVNQ